MRRNNKAMTFAEMMIVCAIIGILASIAIVTYTITRKKAILTEAVTAMGSIRSIMRHYYAEFGTYEQASHNLKARLDRTDADTIKATYPEYLSPGYLDGAYFRDECYFISTPSATSYFIRCYPGYSTNQAAQKLADGNEDNSWITMYPDGSFRQMRVSASRYPPE